jgi:hypothetical protein
VGAREELRCDVVQGYYVARPQSAERIEALLGATPPPRPPPKGASAKRAPVSSAGAA